MNQQTEKRLLRVVLLPTLATELRRLLDEHGESELAEQVRTSFPLP